jgi:hypothetical protein
LGAKNSARAMEAEIQTEKPILQNLDSDVQQITKDQQQEKQTVVPTVKLTIDTANQSKQMNAYISKIHSENLNTGNVKA